MSRGIGAFARKTKADNSVIVYNYGNYNLNRPENEMEIVYDGELSISIDALKKAALRKEHFDILTSEQIQITNCSSAIHYSTEEFDMMAIKLLGKLIREYRKDGLVPDNISIHI